MAEALTFEKVWQMFQETDRIVKENAVQIKETSAQMKETDRKMQETDRKMQETDRKMQETDRKMQETDRKMQETDRIIKELARRFGDLGNRLGEFVEEMVKPACVRLFRDRGIVVHEVHSRTLFTDGKRSLEFDVLVVNDREMVAVECKSRLTRDAVERHLERLREVKGVVPKYEKMKIYGAVAGLVLDGDARELAERSGLFVLAQSGEAVAILNAESFTPAVF